jgi:hypothetical protein
MVAVASLVLWIVGLKDTLEMRVWKDALTAQTKAVAKSCGLKRAGITERLRSC